MKIRKIISLVAVICSVAALSVALHITVSAEYQTEEVYATTEVTTITQLSEHEVRLIVREEYGTYLSTVNTSLVILTAFAAIFALVVPITQVILHERKFKELKGEIKERTEKLDKAIDDSKELQIRLGKAEEQVKAQEDRLKDFAITSEIRSTEHSIVQMQLLQMLYIRASRYTTDAVEREDDAKKIKEAEEIENQLKVHLEKLKKQQSEHKGENQ